ncbi:transposase [Stenotrophomonas sp. YIM B06876]|uniref:transposase n=1 Tax=Stenotrophomonas sp. YIM B06876 TaxID=3060211 RepID=UPI0027397F09|nr:transposase [Stenotrophomonas sp. YIM B06876]
MARKPRADLAGVTQHVIQRGNDRQPCFFRDIDHQRYLQDLREITLARDCHVHAYVLMTNHVHLLMTPTRVGAISSVMQALGRRYVRYINDAYGRTGTLWEGRYKSHLVANDEHLLRCYRYIELNPVRAGMVATADQYRWSSHAGNTGTSPDPLLHPQDCYQRLGPMPADRQQAARERLQQASAEDASRFAHHLHHQQPMGNDRFRAAIEAQLGRSITPRKVGRPRKQSQENPASEDRD